MSLKHQSDQINTVFFSLASVWTDLSKHTDIVSVFLISYNPDPSGLALKWLHSWPHTDSPSPPLKCNLDLDTPLRAHMQTHVHLHAFTHTLGPHHVRVPPSRKKKGKKNRPRTQTQKPTSRCSAVGRSDKSIWGKLSVRNFRSNCRGQNWLLGRANPAAWGWGTMGGECVDVRPVAGEGQWTD